MARKIRGRGCIFQVDKGEDGKKPKSKCRKWRLVVSVGKDPRSGKYRQKAKTFHGSYAQASRALSEFIAQIEASGIVERSDWTFNSYAEHYVNSRLAVGEIQERTANNMRYNFKALGHRIGGLRLQEITPETIETAYIELRNGLSLSGKPLSGRTLYNINICAYTMFKDAKEKGILSENPLDKIHSPKKDTKEKRSLSAATYSSLLSALDPSHHMQCAVLLCAALGLRRSESLGLSWGDIDFAEGIVDVHASTDDHGNLKEPKSEAGYRLLPMNQHVSEALMRRKAAIMPVYLEKYPELTVVAASSEERAPAGAVDIDGKIYDMDPRVAVCCDKQGRRPRPESLSRWWIANRKRFGLEGWTLHALRHSFLSLAAAQGVHPSVMMRLAGHQNPNITMKIYTHVNMDSKRKAMEAMEAAYVMKS